MKQYSIREVQKGFPSILDDAPFEVTRRGKSIARVEKIDEKVEAIKKALLPMSSRTNLCQKHKGSMKMTCGRE